MRTWVDVYCVSDVRRALGMGPFRFVEIFCGLRIGTDVTPGMVADELDAWADRPSLPTRLREAVRALSDWLRPQQAVA